MGSRAGSIRKIFFPKQDPAGKNPVRPELKQPGIFFACDFWSGQIFFGSSGYAGKIPVLFPFGAREIFRVPGTNCAEPVRAGFLAGSPSPVSLACVWGGAGLVVSGRTPGPV